MLDLSSTSKNNTVTTKGTKRNNKNRKQYITKT